MSVTVAQIQQRLAGLRKGFENAQRAREIAEANCHAQAGAIAECEFWLVEAQKAATPAGAQEEPAAGLQVVK